MGEYRVTNPEQLQQHYLDLVKEHGSSQETMELVVGPAFGRMLGATVCTGHHMHEKIQHQRIQNFVSQDNFLAPRVDVGRILEKQKWLDEGWQAFYDVVDTTGSTNDTFTIKNFDGTAITFTKREEGEETRVYEVSDSDVTFHTPEYSAGMEFSYRAIEHNDFFNIARTANAFSRAAFQRRHRSFYNLISAARADEDVAYDDTDGATQIAKDVNTIDAGISEMLEGLEDTEVDITPESTIILLTTPARAQRAKRAVAAMVADTTADTSNDYDIKIVNSLNFKVNDLSARDNDSWMIGMPGFNNVAAIHMNPIAMSQLNPSKRGETVYMHQSFGGAVDIRQFRRLALTEAG